MGWIHIFQFNLRTPNTHTHTHVLATTSERGGRLIFGIRKYLLNMHEYRISAVAVVSKKMNFHCSRAAAEAFKRNGSS
jgi:hypothetical protein